MIRKAVTFCLLTVTLLFVAAARFDGGSSVNGPPKAAGTTMFDYGNDWYQPSQDYVKFRVNEDGIYRVTSAELISAGFPVGSFDPNNLHLMYRGEEIHIHVDAPSGNLNYIEFYGKRNDGRIDSTMYREPYSGLHAGDIQPYIEQSLFTDTTAYFLTFDASPGLRYAPFNDQNYGNYTPEPWFRYELYDEFHPNLAGATSNWNHGGGSQYDIFHILNSFYITGEGYVGQAFGFTTSPYSRILQTPYAANVGNPTEVQTRIYGRSSWRHDLRIDVDGSPIYRDTIDGVYIKTRTIDYNQPINNTFLLQFWSFGNQNNNTDNNNYCWSKITYDHLFNMDGQSEIKVKDWQDGNNAYFRFQNSDVSSQAWVYDLTNHQRSVGTATGDTSHIVVPGAANRRQMHVVTDQGLKSVIVEPHHLNNLKDPANGAEFIMITHRSLSYSANQYATYRDTCTFNQLTTKVVYVDEIYDEFSYGSITPLAIKRFCKYAIDNWTPAPKFFLLWGKGQYIVRNHPFNLVPTYAYPACDYDFVSDYDPFDIDVVPEVPIGRVNIYNNDEGITYLNKVNEYEHTPWQSWMKEVVFMGGGNDTTEQKPILSFLRDKFQPYVEAAPLGGSGNYYQKFNTGLISNSTYTSTERINEGSAVVQFFGHSSNNIFDVDIQEPVLYQNFGKYPLLIAFGCYGGNFTADGKSFGERFVLEPGRGSVAYLGNSTAGYLTPLGNLGEKLYPALYNTHMGEPLGVVMQEALRTYFGTWKDQVYVNHAKQMNLQGDPSVPVYAPRKPDLEITDGDVFFTPEDFSASDSTYTINVITRNLGLVTQDSFFLSIRQMAPNSGGWVTHPSIKFPPISRADTLSMIIKNTDGSQVGGINTFDIFVDSTDILDEYSEGNNRLNYQKLIPDDVPAILFPYDFAVIDQNQVSLSAATFVVSQKQEVRYIYEIDTAFTFDSPMYRNSGVIQGTAIFSEWDVPYNLTDSTVYYWRVRLADILPVSWATASFRYIDTKRGWAQAKPPQFFKDAATQIVMNQLNREWEFDQWYSELHAFADEGQHCSYRMANGAYFSELPSGNNLNGLMYTPIRARDLAPSIRGTLFNDWAFAAMPDAQGDIVSAIAQMKTGDYFLCASERNPRISNWADYVVDAFHLIGVDTSKLRATEAGNSLIVLGRKGYPGSGIIVNEFNVFDAQGGIKKYDLRKQLHTNHMNGRIYSTTVGPAKGWNELIWNWNTTDAHNQEDVHVWLYATRPDNTDSLVYSSLNKGTFSLANIDATKYPYMKLEARAADSIYLTAPQLKHWHILYDPAPEAVIDPITTWSFNRDTVMMGDDVTVNFSALNITDVDMDSMLVKFLVYWPDRSSQEVGRVRYGPLLGNATDQYSFTFNTGTYNMSGDLTFSIELNPDGDQPEQYHFNNIFTYNFYVLEDQVNPILDVTFDGKHLMDGDIISPEPEILIQINDENPYLAINDTAYEIHFGLKTPNPNNLPRIFVGGNSQMESIPAELPDNKAQLYFRPGRLEDGDYTLRVQGYDQTGNAAGKTAYEINFKVINASTVSNVLNYPNPFSTSTRWVYTLTGAEIPEVFEIHIYTITGRLVKVIDLHETNDVQFGYTMTETSWDGRDEFGDLLANGVYVYKVVTKLNGQVMDHREEGEVSRLFKNGYGKLYIMR